MNGAYRPEALRNARAERGWTKRQLIRALTTTAAERGIAIVGEASLTRQISGWENGHHYPAQYVELLTSVYGRPAHELGLSAPPAEPPVPDVTYPADSTAAVEDATALWQADLSPTHDVRALPLDANAWQTASLRWLIAADGEPLPVARQTTRVGMGDVESIRTTIDMFAEMDNRFGGGHARTSLIQYLRSDVAQLLEGTYTDPVGRALFATVAEGSLLAAWMSYDSAHHGLAQRYFVHALRLAQTGDDRRLAASILSAMSHQATYLGDHVQAADLARAAIAGIKGHTTPTLLAQFRAMEARALAKAGDAAGSARALSQASTALEQRTSSSDDPEWISYFDEAELSAEIGHSLRDLGQHGPAGAYARESMTGASARSDFFVTMVLADTLLASGDAEQACSVALEAIRAGEQLKSARCVAYLKDFRARLGQVDQAQAVRALHEEASSSRLWLQTG